jgi:hypothetical protein
MLYVIAHDTFFDRDYDTGIRLVPDEGLVKHTLLMLHRGSTSTMFRTATELPESVTEYEVREAI